MKTNEIKLAGTLKKITKLKGTIENEKQLTGTVYIGEGGSSSYQFYEGPHTVTPKPHDMVELETKKKIVTKNIKVLKIPYYATTNIAEGYTVYIGSELEF